MSDTHFPLSFFVGLLPALATPEKGLPFQLDVFVCFFFLLISGNGSVIVDVMVPATLFVLVAL